MNQDDGIDHETASECSLFNNPSLPLAAPGQGFFWNPRSHAHFEIARWRSRTLISTSRGDINRGATNMASTNMAFPSTG